MAKPYERKTRFYWNPRRPYERMISLKTPIRPDQTEQYFEKNLLWETVMGRAKLFYSPTVTDLAVCWDKIYTDKAIKSILADEGGGLVGRLTDIENMYYTDISSPAYAQDFRTYKRVGGTWTLIGSEAIDLTSGTVHLCKMSIEGTTIKGYREDMVTPKYTITDTAHAEGYWGYRFYKGDFVTWISVISLSEPVLEAPSSPSLSPVRYYEIPVIGDGKTQETAFRPQLPEEIADHPRFGKINLLAFTQSAIIQSDKKTGKPKEYIALVEIYPTRPDYCRSLSKSFEALEAISGVKRLRKDVFERRKKRLLES